MQATDVAVTTSGATIPSTNVFTNSLEANSGASVTFSGGSITAHGPSVSAVYAGGASIAFPRGTTILTTGLGSTAVTLQGAGSNVTATGLSVTTHGDPDPSDGYDAPAFTITAAFSS